MTHPQIIESLYRSKDLDECISKCIRQDHRQDFKQELFIILYRYPPDFICTLFNTSGLTFFAARIILNLANNKYEVYHKRYINHRQVLMDDLPIEVPEPESDDISLRQQAEDEEEAMISRIDSAISGLDNDPDRFPYYRAIMEEVVKHGGIRATSRALNIPKTTIWNYINKVRNSIYNDPENIKGIY